MNTVPRQRPTVVSYGTRHSPCLYLHRLGLLCPLHCSSQARECCSRSWRNGWRHSATSRLTSLLSDGPLFAFSLFTPSIIQQVRHPLRHHPYFSECYFIKLGYKSTQANLLSVPVYAWGCIMTCIIGFLGDRIGHRGYINMYVASSSSEASKSDERC